MKLFFTACVAFLLLVHMPIALASEITIRPFLIDKTMVPRESSVETIAITSSYPVRKSIIYATVNEITVDTAGEIKAFVPPSMADRTSAITSWIEVTRGRIEVPAGETVEVPLKISVNPQAKPGEYHAFIGFTEASKRYMAEEKAQAGTTDGVIVKVTVADERQDSMRVVSTVIDRFIINPDTEQVLITIENAGEIPSAPVGELIYYDSRGREITALPVNTDGQVVYPGTQETFSVDVPITGGFGRYKTNLNLTYGENQRASLYDTTSFLLIPLPLMLALFGSLLLLIIIFFVLFRRNMQHNDASEHGDAVTMYVRDGHEPQPKDHDIFLSK